MRLDRWLVANGYFESRHKAQQAIAAGQVWINGKAALEPALPVTAPTEVVVLQGPRYVSQGGNKLEQALQQLPLDVRGMYVLDAGASTGGFTDCLLQHGAALVYAVDVGTRQLHERLRSDQRVVVMEQTDIRAMPALPQPVDLVVADLSFISLTKVLDALVKPLRAGGLLLALIKPQFEQERHIRFKGGIVKNATLQQQAVGRVVAAALQHGLHAMAEVAVGDGRSRNREFFVLFRYDGKSK
ncbi:MAG: TlyA family RNA methyltransferase [Chitinophagales bacterium]|nr:TlyA family RNA methyltransferase [Chitinophagales bacterium]MDW8427242.1 TlyA family RNA methyltransferase [Chitinophagales bacterium]